MNLKNARVLIIGGTSGIGLGVAAAVADRGGIPIVVSRNQSNVDLAIAGLGENARGMTVDLTDPASLGHLVDEVGPIEHLVFSAGEPLTMVGLADLTPATITEFLGTRFIGQLQAVRVFAPTITPGGSITLTSGTAADKPGLGVLPTAVCGAINAMTKALAVELAPLRVNTVAPGPIRTPLWSALGEADREAVYEQFASNLPVGRIGEPSDTALAYAYLMEQEFGTGVVLTVDGGATLV
ncbi:MULTISPECIES: SDR family oxidoreductase [Mycobacterium]|uniref:Short-chain dehydrogenase n=1 Tax=Mycobacterium syngnathidarum TaxID=1908205 RepID=A0A1Q9W378_9MYCO|nr:MULTISPECIES: SDR family oxidoreductase [Mycobacterium]MCG7606441.1 SDR family oxidoreductase [Mycobacterium sp. CnD-18-1]OHU05648.1 short-chain dehydrogenase [Mycobacterium syngnathidarum]OLT87858.1 short-chain dehydrogenase [Mycobacterium syngnathidarum]